MHASTILSVAPPAPSSPEEENDPVRRALADHQARMAVTPDLPALMSTHDVAVFFGVSEYTIRDYVRRGVLPATRLEGAKGQLRFRRQDVLAYLEGRPAATACGCGGSLPSADSPYEPKHDGIPSRLADPLS